MALGKMSVYVLMVAAVCLCAMSDAFNVDRVETMDMSDSSENDLKRMELDKAMTTLDNLKRLFDARKQTEDECGCILLTCKCCVKLFNAPWCLSLEYKPLTNTIAVSLTIDGKTVFDEEFPVPKPPSPCFNFNAQKVCLHFHDFHVDSKAFTGCYRATLSTIHHKIGQFELGCFHINFVNSSTPLLSAEIPVVESRVVEKVGNVE